MKCRQNNKFLGVCSVAVLLTLTSHIVLAGPLRDRINERRALNKQHDIGAAILSGDIRIVRDVPYGSAIKQHFDVYAPKQATNAPVIFMVHGGAWRTGDKSAKSVIDNKVARWVPMGFVLISTNYRLLPQADPLQQAGDIARAVAVAQEKAATWGGDRSKFILMGHSAGAHLVTLLATSPQISAGIISTTWLGTISLDSAAFDVVKIMEAKHARFYDKAFGRRPQYWRSTSPFHAVTDTTRPILAVCSTRRDDSCQQAERFVEKALSLGVTARVLKKNFSHRQINQSLGCDAPYTAEVESFMARLNHEVANTLIHQSSAPHDNGN
jgi:arylformamidase